MAIHVPSLQQAFQANSISYALDSINERKSDGLSPVLMHPIMTHTTSWEKTLHV
jgi:hypothetical protein